MRKLLNLLFVIIAAMVTFAGCAKEETEAPAQTKTVQFFAESIETKTHFEVPIGEGTDKRYPTLWDAGDRVKVLLNLDAPSGVKKLEATAEVTEISDDSKSATFNAEMNTEYGMDSYTFYAVVPSTSYNAKSSSEGRFTVQIPADQTPQENSVDKAAQVLYAVSNTTTVMPSSVQMQFKHFTAYGKLSLVNLTDKVSTVSSVSLEFDDVDIAGKWNYFVTDGSVANKEAGKKLNLTTSNTDNIWFACAPVDVSGKKMILTVNANEGSLVREITFPSGRVFEAGKVSTFTVDMSGIELQEPEAATAYYEKVTSDLVDWSGKYLLVCEKSNKVLSAISTTSTKYGLGADVTISENKIDATATVLAYQIEISKSVDAYVMSFAGEYLTWMSGNSLNVATTLSDNTKWTLTVSDGNATITNVADGSRVIKWNASSPRFACYTSEQTAVQLYKLVETGNDGGNTPSVPVLTVTEPAILAASAGNAEILYVLSNPVEGVAVSASTTVDWISNFSYTTAGKVMFDVDENTSTESREATVTLTYEGAESKNIIVRQNGAVVLDPNFEEGLYWIMATEDDVTKVMVPLSSTLSYGYGPSDNVTDNKSYAKNAFKFTAVEGGYTIQDVSGRYYAADETHKSFQIGSEDVTSGLVWTVSVRNDGTYSITNVSYARTMKYGDGTYTTFGIYTESESNTGVYPTLIKADNPLPIELSSISVSGQTTIFTVGDTFEFDGTVTATYTDGSICTVSPTSVSSPDMTEGTKTVTITYTEGEITKTAEVTITVKGVGSQVEYVTETITGTFNYDSTSKTLSLTTTSGITITQSIASGNTAIGQLYNTATSLRVYKGHALTFTGKTITKIEFTHASDRAGKDITASAGTYTAGSTVSTWVGESNNIKIVNTGTTENVQLRPTKIVVTYQN